MFSDLFFNFILDFYSGDNEDVEINSVGSESDLTQMYVSDEESAPAKLPEVLT